MTTRQKTKEIVESEGRKAITIAGDIGDKDFCDKAVKQVVDELGGLDILVNNAGEQHPDEDIRDITEDQLRRTFQTNIFGMFFLTQAAMPHLKDGSAIVNCTSETMYKGSPGLLDYSATKGAITAFTRSLSKNLVEKGIRVNGVAPGPIWTPLNPSGGQPPEKNPRFRQGHADEAPGPAERSCAVLPVPRLRGFQLHDGPGPPSGRRKYHFQLDRLAKFSQLSARNAPHFRRVNFVAY